MIQRLLSLDFVSNPILLREFRARMRTPKTVVLLVLYLAVLGALTMAFIFVSGFGSGNATRPGENRYILMAVAVIQLVLLAFIAPGLTAGAISGERERQTLNILLTTHLSPFKILFSKLISSMAFIWLVLFSTLPLYAIVLLHGGVSPIKLLYMFGFYLVVMVSFGAIGLFCSTWFKRTGVAVVVSYLISLFLLGGTAIAGEMINVFMSALTGNYVARPSLAYITALNPVMNIWQIFEPNSYMFTMGQNNKLFLPPWLYFSSVYLIASVLLMWLSVRLLTPVKRRMGEKIQAKQEAAE
ncbi:ABC-type transport system involved in multi-copper enzyme maturation permease subunit [Tumebacillus sp. BK434]|uniref:ABC transporter permease n=1 Tax=Tumebacillus sp. BK434 TaxID=2512169 RepID=UPI001052EB92|nr:ABC transporter permease [Tumebacillus sp. BK434]TCP59037.1 ABC-type transport system involved in multi-copper enzyme maturation permease subunit [Tumebacillus sp. BK434]